MSTVIQLDTFITKAVKESDDTIIIEGYANTVTKDRAADVVIAEAWTKPSALTNYKKNPIILFGHNHARPVGKCIELMPDAYGLKIRAEIHRAADPQVFSMVEAGILKTFSIGFYALDADWHDASDTFVITEVELFEISIVAVPCNQDSTFEVSKGMNESSYKDFRAKFLKSKPEPEPVNDEFRNLVKRVYDAVFNKG